MQPTLCALAASRRRGGAAGAVRFRASWMTPGLSSHQMLDAGVAARQHAARKDLKKSKRPFANYFKVTFRNSAAFRLPRIGQRGTISARDAARLMTNPRENWRAPWDGTKWRLTKGRADVVEAVAPAFGDDPLDKVVDQLLDIRFEWDKEDDVVAPSLVPESLYSLTAHCAPYATTTTSSAAVPVAGAEATAHSNGGAHHGHDGEVVLLPDGTTMTMPSRRRRPAYGRVKNAGGHPKRTYRKPSLGFNGVDTVPSLVCDAVRGPLLSSCTEPVLTVRWKAANRNAESVARMLQLRRRVRTVVAVGLPPRVALLLLKAAADEELEDPALDVSLAVAMGENYGSYSAIECLEVLRALRRLALVRHLPAFGALPSSSSSPDLPTTPPPVATAAQLYHNASLVQRAFYTYVEDTAPFLVEKVWSHLPDHSRHLLSEELFLDWLDLLSLAVEVAGPDHLPRNLPNPSSKAPYAAKYLFLRFTLGLDAASVTAMNQSLQFSASAAASSHRGGHTGLYVDDERELVARPLILWLAVSLLVRLVAEALGDVLSYVQRSLHDHAQLAAETVDAALNPSVELSKYLDRIALARPRVVESYRASVAGSRARRGGLRVRLLPFAAFPHVMQLRPVRVASTHGAAATRAARARQSSLNRTASRSAVAERRPLESPFATVFAGSAALRKQVERATAALGWSVSVLRQCHCIVKPITRPPSQPVMPTNVPETTPVQGEDGSVAQRRQALCRDYVRSRVETQMDTLFACIPWVELLEGEGLHTPWVDTEAAATEEGAAMKTDTVASADNSEALPPQSPADVLAMLLEEDVHDSAATKVVEAAEAPHSETNSESLSYSEAELAMRSAMEDLNGALGEFEVVVADVLDCYETFFDIARHDETESTTV